MKYEIYHALDSQIGVNVQNNVPREYVGTVDAANDEEAFELSNNIDSNWHPEGKRSTSVGDVIRDVENDDFMLVLGMGMMSIDWSELGCDPYVEPGTTPKYLYHKGEKYDYSEELEAMIDSDNEPQEKTGE